MRAGRLRHRVTIQQLVPDPSIGGEDSWHDYATVWAAVEPLRGREYLAAQQEGAEVTGRITIRYIAGLKPTMRIKYGERIYQILSGIDPEERNAELQLMVKEVL